MTYADKIGLLGRAETQVLLGDPVLVVEEHGGWSSVVVPGQATTTDGRGYPGWLPSGQLAEPVPQTDESIIVVAPVTRLFADPDADGPSVELSFGTMLPVRDRAPGWVRVAVPAGGLRWLPERDASAAEVDAPSGADLLASAAGFLGLPYLWAGVSAYGFDCSGLVHAVHRRHGVVIPRDADDQSRGGKPVPLAEAEPGDLLFFAHGHGRGDVHHVAMYAGAGKMLHAPDTGRTVEVVAIDTGHYAGELCAARRYR